MMRVFAAVEIPDEIKKRILEASKYFAFRDVTLVKENALHLTLQFFGEIDDMQVDEIKEAMRAIKPGAFKVTMHSIGFFRPERIRVVYVGVSEGMEKITGIHNELIHKLNVREEERFIPHATIARVRGMRDRRAFTELVSEYEDHDFGSFTVDSITLKSSTLSASGPAYEDLYKSEL